MDRFVQSKPDPESFDYLVVGAGLSGSVVANQIATRHPDKTVLVVDKRDHIGGNCYDYTDLHTGIRINKYGAHLFHTNSKRVWDFVAPLATWIRWDHRVIANVEGHGLVNLPININTVNRLCDTNIQTADEMQAWIDSNGHNNTSEEENGETVVVKKVGRHIYNLLFKEYTFKQWNKYPSSLHSSVLARIPVRTNHDDRYFSDRYQALPKEGYTAIFEKLLEPDNITVSLSTDFHQWSQFNPNNLANGININTNKKPIIIYTGPIDHYFSQVGYPALEYRSISFKKETIRNCEYYQPNSVVNYPGKDVNYTRIVEYKHFLDNPTNSPDTIIVSETTNDHGDPYYPVPNKKNSSLYAQYQQLSLQLQDKYPIHFLGRLATYKYLNMDQAILAALEWCEREIV